METGRDRRALVADAGFSQISWVSVLAGVLVAYGAFAVLVGIAAGIVDAVDSDIDLTRNWDRLGTAGALVVAGVLFVAYLAGGYVAGRMARRAGTLHGALVFLFGVVVVAAVAVAVRQLADTDAVVDNLRDLGVPTTADEWGEVGTLAGIASLAGMLLGSVLGGSLGERWHAKLLKRALDPEVGAEAENRRRAEEAMARAGEHHTGSQERVRTASPTWGGGDVRDRDVGDGGLRDRDVRDPAVRDRDDATAVADRRDDDFPVADRGDEGRRPSLRDRIGLGGSEIDSRRN